MDGASLAIAAAMIAILHAAYALALQPSQIQHDVPGRNGGVLCRKPRPSIAAAPKAVFATGRIRGRRGHAGWG